MKRKYYAPETFQTACYDSVVMGSASRIEATRNVGGGPTDEGRLPGVVGETDGKIDPYGGHGQGEGGGGNRGKEFDLWDIEPFDVWD